MIHARTKLASPILTVLREELALYGLNPNDWFFQRSEGPRKTATLNLQHRRDASFSLRADLASAAYGQLKILQLSVVSI